MIFQSPTLSLFLSAESSEILSLVRFDFPLGVSLSSESFSSEIDILSQVC